YSPAPVADSAGNVLAEWNAVYDAHNEELKSMFEKQARVERFDLIQTFHACKQEEGKSVSQYVLKMKGYVEQLKCLGYMLPQDLSVGLILNGLTSDFARFVRNYNMHNMGKTIGELHAMLIEYEKGLPRKAATAQVMAIHGGRIQKANKKSQNAKGKVVARNAEFFEKNLLSQEVTGRAGDLEEIQDKETSPSEITSKIPIDVEGFEPPYEEEAHVRRSERPHRAPNRLCLNVEVEEHSLGDLNEPANYKAAMDGNVHTYKARLVAKGFTQTYGVDYEEMFSPVADIRAIRILIVIAAFYDYEIWKVCKLQRSIYGLKQASRSWNKRFDEEIKNFGFTQNLDEPCVYQKASGSNVTFLILYVDDIIVMGNHIPSLQSVKEYLGKCFAMKDLGEAIFILGIKIYTDRSRRLIRLSQSAYMDKILKRYRMDNSKRGYIPMQERLDLNKTQGASTPEENHGELYWTAVKTILKYLGNTKDMFLVYGGNPEAELRVDCYCDARFETDRDDTKSQTGYIFILNGGAIDLKSSKQSTTTMFATEAEHIAASEAGMKAVWIRKFISGLGIVPTINKPIRMFCDNSAALQFANEPRVQRGARHFHRKYHYVRECIKLGKIKFLKVHTYDDLADPFTKALSNKRLTQHARSMGLRLASSFMKVHCILSYCKDNRKNLPVSKLGCVLSQELVAFCLEDFLHFVSRPHAFCLKTYCVLSHDFVAFCLKTWLRFVSRPPAFCLKTYCVLSHDFVAFCLKTSCEQKGAPHLGPERLRIYSDLSLEEKDRYNADIRATNILLQGLPKDIYTLINHYTDAKDIWDDVKMLLKWSELTKEDRESQLYDDFEHFRQHKGETIHDYYVWFTKLINDMRNIKMTMSRMQLNSKFVNNMLPEWGRFVTVVKLNKGLRDSNYDQLYAYLK
nr:hypothetical protein [Tanacetum cinerariifolium]